MNIPNLNEWFVYEVEIENMTKPFVESSIAVTLHFAYRAKLVEVDCLPPPGAPLSSWRCW